MGEFNLDMVEMHRLMCLCPGASSSQDVRDLDDKTDTEWERQAKRLAERWAVRRTQTFTKDQGRLIPIGEPEG